MDGGKGEQQRSKGRGRAGSLFSLKARNRLKCAFIINLKQLLYSGFSSPSFSECSATTVFVVHLLWMALNCIGL